MKRNAETISHGPTPAEQDGKATLYKYYREYHGCQAKLSRDTGISVPVLTKLARYPDYAISLEYAMMIEVATNGELRAEVLCPSRADLVEKWLAVRAGEQVAA